MRSIEHVYEGSRRRGQTTTFLEHSFDLSAGPGVAPLLCRTPEFQHAASNRCLKIVVGAVYREFEDRRVLGHPCPLQRLDATHHERR